MKVRDATELRRLARWYRDFAERAGNPVIWEARLRMADDLEREAQRMERASHHGETTANCCKGHEAKPRPPIGDKP